MEASRLSGPNFRSLVKLILENWMLLYMTFFFFFLQVYIVSHFAENNNLKRS